MMGSDFRHPLLPASTVVPNSYISDAHPDKTNIHILTGFNCSGKTIYIKQVRILGFIESYSSSIQTGLLIYMAQIGRVLSII